MHICLRVQTPSLRRQRSGLMDTGRFERTHHTATAPRQCTQPHIQPRLQPRPTTQGHTVAENGVGERQSTKTTGHDGKEKRTPRVKPQPQAKTTGQTTTRQKPRSNHGQTTKNHGQTTKEPRSNHCQTTKNHGQTKKNHGHVLFFDGHGSLKANHRRSTHTPHATATSHKPQIHNTHITYTTHITCHAPQATPHTPRNHATTQPHNHEPIRTTPHQVTPKTGQAAPSQAVLGMVLQLFG